MNWKRICAIGVVCSLLLVSMVPATVSASPTQNQIMVGFNESYVYIAEGDSFTNHEVEGQKYWGTEISNYPDSSGEPISGLTLELNDVPPEPVLEWFIVPPPSQPEPLPGPDYEWSSVDIPPFYEEVPEEGNPIVHVGYSDNPEIFTPGFDVSRSVNKTVFSKSGIQTLQVTITPHEEVQWVQFLVLAHGNPDLVNPTIISLPKDESLVIGLDNEGRDLFVGIEAPVKDLTYTFTIKIKVDLEPNAGTIEFIPRVDAWTIEATTVDPPINDYWVSRDSAITVGGDSVGEWTWNAEPSSEGSYEWHRGEGYIRLVGLKGYCKQIILLPSERNGSSVVRDPIGDIDPTAPAYADIRKAQIVYQVEADKLIFSMNLDGVIPPEPPDNDLPEDRIIYNWFFDIGTRDNIDYVVSASWTTDDEWVAGVKKQGHVDFIAKIPVVLVINGGRIEVTVELETIEKHFGQAITELYWASVTKFAGGLSGTWDIAPDESWAYWSR